jgi:hypothetical protein
LRGSTAYCGADTGPTGIVDDNFVGSCQIMSGTIFQRSMIKISQIADGTSQTYLVGEKFVSTDMYETGEHIADNGPMYTGFDKDIERAATSIYPPTQDQPSGGDVGYKHQYFGSAHPGVWQVVFCDGSVRSLSYFMDPKVHHYFGHRYDGNIIDISTL